MGLVSKVVPDAALMEAALELAGRIACNPPRSLRLTKRLLREGQNSRMDDVLELSAAYQALAHETADHVRSRGRAAGKAGSQLYWGVSAHKPLHRGGARVT
jgi:enoyl-CoA hydratase/carnithine racemase